MSVSTTQGAPVCVPNVCKCQHGSAAGSANTTATAFWNVLSGPCKISGDGNCVMDSGGVNGTYKDNERCVFQVTRTGSITATQFQTESILYDYFTIGTTKYGGNVGPLNITV